MMAPFVLSGTPARAKIVLLGPSQSFPDSLMDRTRSLNLEHVSPCRVQRPEISRRSAPADADEAFRLAPMRHWFFSRKPDAGFVLTDFPATLLQAKVLDEWLASRDESLDAVIAAPGADLRLIEHYRSLGLLSEGTCPALP